MDMIIVNGTFSVDKIDPFAYGVYFLLLFSLMKKVTKKSSQNDVPALFVFIRFASKRELKLFWAHLINTNSQLVRRRVLTSQRALLSEFYKRDVLKKLRHHSASASISHESMMNIRCGTMILCSNSSKMNEALACASGFILSAVRRNCLSQNHKLFGYFLAAKSD